MRYIEWGFFRRLGIKGRNLIGKQVTVKQDTRVLIFLSLFSFTLVLFPKVVPGPFLGCVAVSKVLTYI